jgi:hypothetical protein
VRSGRKGEWVDGRVKEGAGGGAGRGGRGGLEEEAQEEEEGYDDEDDDDDEEEEEDFEYFFNHQILHSYFSYFISFSLLFLSHPLFFY